MGVLACCFSRGDSDTRSDGGGDSGFGSYGGSDPYSGLYRSSGGHSGENLKGVYTSSDFFLKILVGWLTYMMSLVSNFGWVGCTETKRPHFFWTVPQKDYIVFITS